MWENLDIARIELKNPVTGATKVVFLTPQQEKDDSHMKDETGATLEVQTRELVTDWSGGRKRRRSRVPSGSSFSTPLEPLRVP